MSDNQLWLDAKSLVERVGELPRPWDVRALCRRLAAARGRPLTLRAVDLPALPFGMWLFDGTRDVVMYPASATGYYRDHIILHEICHLLSGHGTPAPDPSGPAGPGTAPTGQGSGNAYSNREELLAETFASMVLKIAGQQRRAGASAVERRAAELLGGARA